MPSCAVQQGWIAMDNASAADGFDCFGRTAEKTYHAADTAYSERFYDGPAADVVIQSVASLAVSATGSFRAAATAADVL